MTREEVQNLFPDATKEQITALLNKTNSELASEKSKAEKFKAEANKASELQKQLSEIEQANMTELEKSQALNADIQKKLEDVTKQFNAYKEKADLKEKFSAKGITGENADKLIDSLSEGKFDIEVFDSIIQSKIAEHDEATLKNTKSAGGSGASEEKDTEGLAVKLAKQMGDKSSFDGNSILSTYINQ